MGFDSYRVGGVLLLLGLLHDSELIVGSIVVLEGTVTHTLATTTLQTKTCDTLLTYRTVGCSW